MSVLQVGRLDTNFAWDGAALYEDARLANDSDPPEPLRGAAGLAASVNGGWRLMRDPLGLNKVFWARHPEGKLLVAARPWLLVEKGCSFDEIFALPRGAWVDAPGNGSAPRSLSLVPQWWFDPETARTGSAEVLAEQIRATLTSYLEAVASAYPSAEVFVCLSGGLDSSGIAALAADHFSNLAAVTFDLERSNGRVSDDRATAERLARDLGLPLLRATVTPSALVEKLDIVLREGIDWRDFNVHAGLVNAALAEAISRAATTDHVIVLTGDLANEFLADYEEERHAGVVHYRLPRIAPDALRSSLVIGIETSHREIGIFAAWNLALVQPYAVAVDSYLALPTGLLSRKDRKQELCRMILEGRLPSYIYDRPKVRAQIGSTEGDLGVLGVCLDRGLDAKHLRERFAALHGLETAEPLNGFIRAGRYRAELPPI